MQTFCQALDIGAAVGGGEGDAQARLPDGRRVITAIVEVAGTESGRIQIQELFRHEQRGRDAEGRVLGRFTGCNAVPAFYEELAESGVQLDLSLFSPPGEGGGA